MYHCTKIHKKVSMYKFTCNDDNHYHHSLNPLVDVGKQSFQVDSGNEVLGHISLSFQANDPNRRSTYYSLNFIFFIHESYS